MFKPFIAVFRRPHFADEEKTRVAALLHSTFLFGIPINIVSFLYVLSLGPDRAAHLISTGLAFVIIYLELALIHRGYLQLVGSMVSGFFCAVAMFMPLVVDISGGLIAFNLLMAMLFAGASVGLGALILVVIFSAIAWVFWALVDVGGLVVPLVQPFDRLNLWVTESIFFFLLIGFLLLVIYYLNFGGQQLKLRDRALQATSAQLRETTLSYDYLDNIFHSMAEMLVVASPEGLIEHVNRATLRTLGYTEEELLGRPIGELFADSPPHSLEFNTLRRRGQMERVERHYRTRSGETVVVLLSGAVMQNSAGEITGMVTVGQDVTELRRMRIDLEATNLRYNQAVSSTGLGVWELDLQTGEMVFDNSAKALFGFADAELENSLDAFYNLMPPDDVADMTIRLTAYLKNPVGVYTAEHRIYHKDGRLLSILMRGSVQFEEGTAKPLRLIAVCIDITERKQMEQRLLEAQQREISYELERSKMRLLTDIFRDVSHDFRTPLSIINTSLHLLERSPNAEDRRSRAQTIERQTLRLSRLLDSLFIMIRLDSEPTFIMERFDLNALVRDTASAVQRAERSRKLDWTLDLSPDKLPVRADEAELRRAIQNILENAVEYTPDGGKIIVSTAHDPSGVSLSVRDTGIGISEADQTKIFQRLYRVDKARSPETGGVGLGLSIAQRIINLHGGRIEVESVLGQGSTFTIRLPGVETHQINTA